MNDIKQYEPLWGSWYVEELLGEGSFGKVYKVRKEEFGRVYYSAVKMISIPQTQAELEQAMSEGLDDASARSYFQTFVTDIIQEIDLMTAFKGNTNIVSIEDHEVIEKKGTIGWDILIRMELLTTLSSYRNSHALTNEDIIQVGIDIARALELCAMKKIIHRDIKPDNIFVSQYGDYKLGDFGIARQIERTMSGLSKKGTYTYMAPEVFKGEEYGSSVDLYSLGIVMYRYLNNNRTPFLPAYPAPISPRDRDEALKRRMTGEKLPDIPDIDPELNALILKACAYEREERFKDATEFRIELEKFAGTAPKPPIQEIQREPVKAGIKRPRSMREREEDEGKTVGVFALHNKAPESVPEVSENVNITLSPKTVNIIALLSALLSGVLAVISLVSHDFASTVIFAGCAVLCVTRFKYKYVNFAFMIAASLYLVLCALMNFGAFDYSLLTFTLGMFAIESRDKKRIFSIVMLILALISSGLIFRTLSGGQSVSFRAYTAASFGVPLIMLTASVIILLRDNIAGFLALQFFQLITFVMAFVTGSMTLINIVNASFVTILLEITALELALITASAKRVPELITDRKGALIASGVTFAAMITGLILIALI